MATSNDRFELFIVPFFPLMQTLKCFIHRCFSCFPQLAFALKKSEGRPCGPAEKKIGGVKKKCGGCENNL
jgi:hypothetical protein